MHGSLDLPVCCRDFGQQIRALGVRVPLPDRTDVHAYALLLVPGLHRHQAWHRRSYADHSGHLPKVRPLVQG
jgi:hypothetical protein